MENGFFACVVEGACKRGEFVFAVLQLLAEQLTIPSRHHVIVARDAAFGSSVRFTLT